MHACPYSLYMQVRYLDSSRDVQMQFISKRTHSLERPHVLHVANPPSVYRQKKQTITIRDGDAGFISHAIMFIFITCIDIVELNKHESYNLPKFLLL